MMKLLATVACLFIGGMSIANAEDYGEMKKWSVHKFVPSGTKRPVYFVINNIQADCDSIGQTEIRTVVKPEHGYLEFIVGQQFMQWPKDHHLFKCNAKKIPGTVINYTSDRAFSGDDATELLMLFPDGSAAQVQLQLHVK